MAPKKQATPKNPATPSTKAPPNPKPKTTTTPRKKPTPKNQPTPPPLLYTIRGTHQHELNIGLFATTPIAAGTLILSEPPLYTAPLSILTTSSHTIAQETILITTLANMLDPLQRQDLASLWRRGDRLWVSVREGEGEELDEELDEGLEDTPFMGVVCGAAIPLCVDEEKSDAQGGRGGFGMVGVFRVLSRVNHACVPNCQVVWSGSTSSIVDDNEREHGEGNGEGNGDRKGNGEGEGNDGNRGGNHPTAKLYATHPIKPGQQLTISYVPNSALNHSYLTQTYGFACMCKTFCLRSQDFKDRYTARLQTLNKLLARLNQPVEGAGDIYLQHAYKALTLMRVLGIADFRLARLWRVVFGRMVEKGMRAKAQFFAVHTFLVVERCEGRDGDGVERLVRDVNVAFRLGDVDGVDVEGGFVKLVERCKGMPGYLGFVEDGDGGGGTTGEVFTEKCLVEMFGKKRWMVDLPGEDEVDEDGGLFVEEDDPVVEEEEVAPPESTEKKVKATATLKKKEDHRAKPASSEKTPKKSASSEKPPKPTSSEKKKKKTDPKRTLPPVPLFPKLTKPNNFTEPSPSEDLPMVDMFTPSSASKAKTSKDEQDKAIEEWQRQRTTNQQHLKALAESQVRAGVLIGVGGRRVASASFTRGEEGEGGESGGGSGGRVGGKGEVIDLTGEDGDEVDDE